MNSLILHRHLADLRRRWTLRTWVRGGLAGLGLAAGAVLLLVLLAALGLVPGVARPTLRWLPLGALLLPLAGAAFVVIARAPSDRRLALRLDETDPELKQGAVTLLELPADHPYADSIRARVEGRLVPEADWSARFPGRLSGEGTRALSTLGLLAVALVVVGIQGGPGAVWTVWGSPPGSASLAGVSVPGDRSDPGAVEELGDLSDRLVVTVRPPSYTGLPERRADLDSGVDALAGSVLHLSLPLPAGGDAPELRRVRPEAGSSAEGIEWTPFERGEPGEWTAEFGLDAGDRGVVLRLGDEWILPVRVRTDDPPEVELLEPTRDLVLATGTGEVTLRARARDAFGIESFELGWMHTRGSGESFDFRDGRIRWDAVEEQDDGTLEGRLTLDLESMGMGPGDVLHLRALARDGNLVTGPGEGVSRTRQLRVIREGDEMAVDALIGLPVDVEQEPVLSQRMILLMTEELVAAAPSMEPAEVRTEALRIGREQNRLRTRIGEEVFSRATGAMEEVVLHLGVEFDPHGGRVGVDASADQVRHDHDVADDHDHAADSAAADSAAAAATRGSRYGVASIFDPSSRQAAAADTATEVGPPGGDHHDHDHGDSRGARLDFGAGENLEPLFMGRPGELPTGFGELEALGHDHDGNPILSVNRPLLEIYNAMWESERYLGLIDPDASTPHQIEALDGLQALRENTRVFPRGRVTVPPVDVTGVRGTGEVDDASPTARTPGQPRPSSSARLGELDRLLLQLSAAGAAEGSSEATTSGPTESSAVREPPERTAAARTAAPTAEEPAVNAGNLHEFAISLLEDPLVPADISAAVVRASRLWQRGEPDAAVELLQDTRREWAPSTRGRAGRFVEGPEPSLLLPLADPGVGGEAPAGTRPGSGADVEAPPFVFATLRYESGNWDSAPLVPQNLIHSLAQYTEIPVAPEGVVVDLSSDEIFRYPVLYLTGHLPVRFSDAEARNLERYVRMGGFVFMDDHNHDIDGAFHRTATAELARIFGDDALEPLPGDHELYRSFFQFEDGPPTTSHELSGWGDGLIHPELHAVMVDGRIGVLYSNKDYSSEWSYHAVNKRFLAVDNTRFGVNLLLYALTR